MREGEGERQREKKKEIKIEDEKNTHLEYGFEWMLLSVNRLMYNQNKIIESTN